MSKPADLMNGFAAEWAPKDDLGRTMFLEELAKMVSEIRDHDRRRIEERIEQIRQETMGGEKPAGVSEFETMLREIAKDWIHTDEGDGPICSLCGNLAKPRGAVNHDPACLTVKARKLITDLEKTA